MTEDFIKLAGNDQHYVCPQVIAGQGKLPHKTDIQGKKYKRCTFLK